MRFANAMPFPLVVTATLFLGGACDSDDHVHEADDAEIAAMDDVNAPEIVGQPEPSPSSEDNELFGEAPPHPEKAGFDQDVPMMGYRLWSEPAQILSSNLLPVPNPANCGNCLLCIPIFRVNKQNEFSKTPKVVKPIPVQRDDSRAVPPLIRTLLCSRSLAADLAVPTGEPASAHSLLRP